MSKNVIGVLCDKRNKKVINQTAKYALSVIKKEVDNDLFELIETVERNVTDLPVEVKQLIIIYLINQQGQVQASILRKSSQEFKESLLFGLKHLCTAFDEKRIASPKKVIRGARKLNKYVCKKIAQKK